MAEILGWFPTWTSAFLGECAIRAVNFGGETGTVGAMAGAAAGALYRRAWIPVRWFENIENGENGHDEMIELGRRLPAPDVRWRFPYAES